MNKFLKIVFFNCFFSYIFSTTVTNIEPSTVILGENVTFTLTVQNYNLSEYDYFNIREKYEYYGLIRLKCDEEPINNLLKCSSLITFSEIKTNLIKNLFIKNEDTGLTVTIIKPTNIKFLNIDYDYYVNNYYSYIINKFYFKVNYNELYNSSVSIKFGDVSITDCKKDNETIDTLYCYCVFNESYIGKTLSLIFNGEVTEFSITIEAPSEFSIIKYLEDYYSSPSIQYIRFEVDSSYKINEHSIVLVPFNSKNKNITLSSCTSDEEGIKYAKCSGLLDTVESYYIYLDNENIDRILIVYLERTIINNVIRIWPTQFYFSPSVITFYIEVDYVANLDKMNLTLMEENNPNIFFDLYNCEQIEGTTNKIKCLGNVIHSGYYYVYLNGVFQKYNDLDVIVTNNSTLTRAEDIYPLEIKFNSSLKTETIEVYYDTNKGLSSKNITLKGVYNTIVLNYDDKYNYKEIEYNVTFPSPDTYYLYIDNVNQNLSIKVTTESFISKIISIYPTYAGYNEDINYTLTLDTNYGIFDNKIILTNGKYEDELYCKPDRSDKTKAYCQFRIGIGDFYFLLNETEFKNINIKSKEIPKIDYYYPITIFASSNIQKVALIFNDYVANYTELIKFVGDNNTIEPICESISDEFLLCSAEFKNEGKYFITIEGYFTEYFFNVFNIYEKNQIEDENSDEIENEDEDDEEDDNKGNIYNLKKILFLLSLFIFI